VLLAKLNEFLVYRAFKYLFEASSWFIRTMVRDTTPPVVAAVALTLTGLLHFAAWFCHDHMFTSLLCLLRVLLQVSEKNTVANTSWARLQQVMKRKFTNSVSGTTQALC